MAQPEYLDIAGRRIGPGQPCFIIAEVAQAHDGSLGAAHAYVDMAAAAGADAVKFQTHFAKEESTPGEPWRVKFSKQDATRYEYWQRMEFTPEQWAGLADHATKVGLVFLSSAFSNKAVALLERLDMPAWKIASGEVSNHALLERMVATDRPLLLSSGMSSWQELDDAIGHVRTHGGQVGVFQTTTSYPCPPERIGLNVMAELRERYGCPVGLSDHSAVPETGIAAAALGANMVEVHIVFSKDCFGPDTSSSLTREGLERLVNGIRHVERIVFNTVDKDRMAEETADLRRLFSKSIVAARDLEAGAVLTEADIAFKKPGTGINAARWARYWAAGSSRPFRRHLACGGPPCLKPAVGACASSSWTGPTTGVLSP